MKILKYISLVFMCMLLMGNSECPSEKQYPYASTPVADNFTSAGNFAYPLDYDSTLGIAYVGYSNLVQLYYTTKEGEEKLAVYGFYGTISTKQDSIGGKEYYFPKIFNFEHLPEDH